jgi:hypothetical protein
MPIEQKDLERIERIILRCTGDIAEAIGRSIERLEERIDAAESRICGHLPELDDGLPTPTVGSAD